MINGFSLLSKALSTLQARSSKLTYTILYILYLFYFVQVHFSFAIHFKSRESIKNYSEIIIIMKTKITKSCSSTFVKAKALVLGSLVFSI